MIWAPFNCRLEINELNIVNIVVNTGYQSISKERSAGSYAKPDMKLVAERSTSMNILQRLDGLVPGLTINNASQSRNPISIRGLTTIGVSARMAPAAAPTGILCM